jgi:Cu(I)/Ag(I) efflux system membrane fusion protein
MKRTLILLLVLATVGACTQKGGNTSDSDHTTHAVEKYTCPMHPSVVQDGPGQCPVCGMDLVPQKQSSGTSSDLMLTDTQMKLANVTTQVVSVQAIGQIVPINARLVANEDLTEVVSARVNGRIERLFIKEAGKTIRAGEPLYEIYSETLLTLQQEYLLAKTQYEKLGTTEPRYESFLRAAEKKLLLYGLTKDQVADLAIEKIPRAQITFLSPATGIVKQIYATEGQSVSEGMSLYQIENTQQLWLEAELYSAEAAYVKRGDKIKVLVAGSENEPIEAVVNFLSPEIRANTQVTVFRATVPNRNLQWKPGQSAQVLLAHSAKRGLAIPVDAVIRDERGTHVYVQTDINTFAPRNVKTGVETFELVEITEGLSAGETIAVTGAYLLYSEIILKRGTDPMASASATHAH